MQGTASLMFLACFSLRRFLRSDLTGGDVQGSATPNAATLQAEGVLQTYTNC